MNRFSGRTPSPAMVVACLALFLAMTSTGVAVVNALPKGSVGTKQLKNGAVGTKQLKNDAVISSKVKNHSLKAVDFALGQLPKGAKGNPGVIGSITIRNATVSVLGGTSTKPKAASVTRQCSPDERAISAGTGWSTPLPNQPLYTSYLLPLVDTSGGVTGYQAAGANESVTARTFTLYVLCYVP
jgi:hypothetical protein